jgi:hypothetical protein
MLNMLLRRKKKTGGDDSNGFDMEYNSDFLKEQRRKMEEM